MIENEQWAGEDKLIAALAEVLERCSELQVDLMLIGAFAVRAYAERRRLTTDIDFVATSPSMNTLASIFKSLGYAYYSQTRFGGIQAVKYLGEEKIQLDIAIDSIRDESSGHEYQVPSESFLSNALVEIEPLQGGTGVMARPLPLADLLICKLIPSREQDMADMVTLTVRGLSPDVINEFQRKVRQTNLNSLIYARLGEMIRLSDRELQNLLVGYTGGRLTGQECRTLRRVLRQLGN